MCLVLAGNIIAQSSDPTQLPDIVPPSPEAASFAKFSDVPVSHYTGLPQISIPFHNIDVDGQVFPVGLSYHARGIKVEEIASSVGIGWTLNAGGAITRQQRGNAADEYPYDGYLNNEVYKDFFTNHSTRSTAYNELLNGKYDMLPDIFHVQAPGLSAKFFLNQLTSEFILQAYDDIDIQYFMENGKIGSFVVTNSDGFKYYFGKSQDNARLARDLEEVVANYSYSADGVQDKNSNNETFRVYNSWKLMDVVSPKGEIVNFYYALDQYPPSFFRRSYDKLDMGTKIPTAYFNEVRSTQHYLEKIIAPNTHVEFIPSTTGRLDLQNAHALSTVKFFNKSGLVRSYDLAYHYNDAIDDSNQLYHLETSEDAADKRLMLSSVTERGKDGVGKPPYVFEYDPTPLPNRFSNSQDYWGYYNGANNGRYLTFFDYGSTSIDRTVNQEKSLAGMLVSIKYPTGGSTSFSYEHNRAKPDGEIENLFFQNPNPATEENFSVGLSHMEHVDYYNGISYEKLFTIGEGINGKVATDVSFSNQQGCYSTYFGAGCKFRVFIYQGGLLVKELFIGQIEFTLAAGDYNLVVEPQGSHDPFNMDDAFSVSLNWKEQIQSNTADVLYTSGKRIKRIDNYDSNQNLVSFKEYEYKRTNGDCSGAVLGMPNFYTINQTKSTDGTIVLEPDGAVPGSPLSTGQGNSIGYGMVTEYYGDTVNNVGKIEYEFSLTKDNQGYMKYPYHLPNDNEWLRGLPLLIRNYRKNADGNYSMVKSIDNTFLYGDIIAQSSQGGEGLMLVDEATEKHFLENDAGDLYNWTSTRYRFPLAIFFNSEDYWDPVDGSGIMYKAFYTTGGTVDKVSTVETTYDGTNPIVTTIDYDFNYSKHYQNSQTRTSTSDQDPLIQTIVYPPDIAVRTNAEERLKQNNRLVPIEVKSYKDYNNDNIPATGELISTVKNKYKNVDKITEIETISVAKKDGESENRVVYHRYDSSGNPMEISKTDGPHIVYLWGYEDQYPIAKIENATFAEIASALGISASTLENYNESNLSSINTLRTSLAEASVTTYIYDPLVGLTSITDPRENTTYYEYDSFNRLEFVKDKDGNIISENKYNYKGSTN
ncbi:hypothetical protein LB467_15825 [Salegentibacter sp. JZCK2]|uniref:RHS repeat domain-containing protein n=1 Tax=Salegentibacter tibetensis TaxID=2873600 RepID=UPI001CCEC7CB|nr:RHS repeat domain-containing protein [Salegentibacter tibetensis]MBZ9731163.1 hypothetical protein [Salegentibacter tibetensis]